MVFADSVEAVEVEVMTELIEAVDKGLAASGSSPRTEGRLLSWLVRMRCCSNILALTASRNLARVSSSGLGPGDLPLAEPSAGVVVVASARVRPGWPASWLKADGARSPAAEAVREVSGAASCSSWATLDTRASGERRSWGRGSIDGDAVGAGVLACSAESVRGSRLAAVLSLGESSLVGAGVCSGRVGFMALWPASVVRARRSRGELSRMRGGMARAATHERVQGDSRVRSALRCCAPLQARGEGAVCCEDACYVMGEKICLPPCDQAHTHFHAQAKHQRAAGFCRSAL